MLIASHSRTNHHLKIKLSITRTSNVSYIRSGCQVTHVSLTVCIRKTRNNRLPLLHNFHLRSRHPFIRHAVFHIQFQSRCTGWRYNIQQSGYNILITFCLIVNIHNLPNLIFHLRTTNKQLFPFTTLSNNKYCSRHFQTTQQSIPSNLQRVSIFMNYATKLEP